MALTEAQRGGLLAAQALLENGFSDYAEHVLRANCGTPGAAPLRLLREGGSSVALKSIRELVRDEA